MKSQNVAAYAALLAVAFSLAAVKPIAAQSPLGSWRILVDQSDDMDPWRDMNIRISVANDSLTLVRHWQAGRYWQHDSMTVSLDGDVNTIPIRPGKWMDHVYLGVFVPKNAMRNVRATWSPDSSGITVVADVPLETAQVTTIVKITSTYRSDETGSQLAVTETRSSRKTGSIRHLFERQ